MKHELKTETRLIEVWETVEELRQQGYTVVKANDAVSDGLLLFKSKLHEGYPSAISFEFRRQLSNGEILRHSFAMPKNSWQTILSEAIKDF